MLIDSIARPILSSYWRRSEKGVGAWLWEVLGSQRGRIYRSVSCCLWHGIPWLTNLSEQLRSYAYCSLSGEWSQESVVIGNNWRASGSHPPGVLPGHISEQKPDPRHQTPRSLYWAPQANHTVQLGLDANSVHLLHWSWR